MKKRFVAILMSIFLVLFGNFMVAYADSGWDYDYDYDYGGGWDYDYDYDYGGGWDYDYDYNYGGGSYSGGSVSAITFFMVIIFIVIIFVVTKKADRRTYYGSRYNANNNVNIIPPILSDEVFIKYPNFNKEKFLAEAFEIYKGIQTAWSEFDYDTLRKLTTDEMYNMYKMQLDTLMIKNEKNIMKDFYKSFIGITDISEVNGILTVKVRLNVSQKDYVINTTTGNVTRGNANMSFNVAYDLTFVNNTSNEILTSCPNCSAPISNSGSQKCEYCNADLIGNSVDNWALAKKETVKQWR